MTRTLFRGGSVFDSRAPGGALATADLVVEDGTVLQVGSGLDGDVEVDVTGRTLLPGLFDCHVHVVISKIDVVHNTQQPFSYQFYEAARNLRTLLGLGITTARDAGGADLGIKRALMDGLLPGPRLQVSLTMLSQTGGHGDDWMPCGATLSLFSSPHPGRPDGVVDGPDEMRRKVRELVRGGADVIKVATSGGVLSPQSDPRHGHFSSAELDVLLAEASGAGRFVMAHAQATQGIKAAVRAGVRSIEHGIFLDDEAVDLMVERGTWLVPTLLAPRGLLEAIAGGAMLPEAAMRKARDVLEAHTASFCKAVDAGVRVAMGTDCPVSPFGTNLTELALMDKLSPMSAGDALVSATSSAAELLGVGDSSGSLEPGKRADIVVVGGDPLDVATLSERIEQVWKDGERVVG